MELFNFLPPHMRQSQLDKLLTTTDITKAIRFPCAYFTKFRAIKDEEKEWQDYDLLWVNVSVPDKDGMVIKAAPDFLIEHAKQVLTNYEQNFEVIDLEQ